MHKEYHFPPYLCSVQFPSNYPNALPVMEHFYTIQGEGAFAGHAAYFIRLAGCDVGCHWCDVKESWTVSPEQWMNIDDIIQQVQQFPGKIVVITGGEPLMYDLGPLTQQLRDAGFRTHIETSGAYPISGDWHWICLSPKKFKAPMSEILPLAHELKVIVFHSSDFKWAEQHAQFVNPDCKRLLQAEWDKKGEMYPLMTEYVKKHPQWNISVQTHKYLNIP